jgi:hypothetical protein
VSVAIVLGGAACVWADVGASETLLGPEWWDLVVAANDIGCVWPRRLDHWCSLHANKLDGWTREREKLGHPDGYVTWAKKGKKPRGVDRGVAHRYGGGSSGLLAVSVALEAGAHRIVCCGVPMTRDGYFSESVEHPQGKTFSSADSHWRKWRLHSAELARHVRSMSGRTRELLGAPDPEWLAETVAV